MFAVTNGAEQNTCRTEFSRWDGETQREYPHLLAVHDYRRDKQLRCVAAHDLAPGPVLAAGGHLPFVPVWSLRTFEDIAKLEVPTGDPITAIGFGAGVLVAGSTRGRLLCWSTYDWRPLWRVDAAHPSRITGVSAGVRHGRGCLITTGEDGMVRTWAADGVPLGRIAVDQAALALSCTPDGRCAVATTNGVIAFLMV